MKELFFTTIIFGSWTVFSILFIRKYKYHQSNAQSDKKSFWNNGYIFESIPSVFPTLGIFCTALGITFGLSGFNTENIQESLPTLLNGLRLAFFATMAGIIGLIVFQKINAIIQKQIDDDPNKPIKQTDELSAIADLSFEIKELKKDNHQQIEKLIQSFGEDLEKNVAAKLSILENKLIEINNDENENSIKIRNKLNELKSTLNENRNEMTLQVVSLRDEQKEASVKSENNVKDIISAMGNTNKLISLKFDEFSELLSKNNTEALVEVMKNVTTQFNEQMSELINRLVQENFEELNNSVKNLNDWQTQNKEQIQKLTEQFINTTELFSISAETLKQVSENTKSLTDSDSKLNKIVTELSKVLIEDGKFQEITSRLNKTVESLENTTESFDNTTSKLNEWVKTEKNFKEGAQILIAKLEEFKDFNGDLWSKYRNEMTTAVGIIKETSETISDDLENINSEFYERLNDTLTSLDQCIQRFIPNNRI